MHQQTADQIRQKLELYALLHGLKMAMIGRGLHDCPIENISGRTLYKVFQGRKVSHGTLSIILHFLDQQHQEND